MEALVDLDIPGEDLTVRLADPAWLSDQQRLDTWRHLRRARNRLDAALHHLVAVIDQDHSFEAEAAPTATTWLINEGESASTARSTVSTARALADMPATTTAFDTGDLDTPRVRLLAAAKNTNPELFTRDEEVLVDSVGSLSAADTRRAIDYWTQAAAPEAAAQAEHHAHQQRRLHISATWAGTVRIDGQLDREAGAIVQTALDTLTDPTNLDPTDTRSAPQRRADALTELCQNHLDHADIPTTGRHTPHITLHVTDTALTGIPSQPCELEDGTVITPQAARRIACDANITTLRFDTRGVPLHITHPTRTIPAALRRALIARDRGCVICGRPPRWCDAHHILHWADGGPTTLDNLVLLCRHHHRLIHDGRIQLPPRHTRAAAAHHQPQIE